MTFMNHCNQTMVVVFAELLSSIKINRRKIIGASFSSYFIDIDSVSVCFPLDTSCNRFHVDLLSSSRNYEKHLPFSASNNSVEFFFSTKYIHCIYQNLVSFTHQNIDWMYIQCDNCFGGKIEQRNGVRTTRTHHHY